MRVQRKRKVIERKKAGQRGIKNGQESNLAWGGVKNVEKEGKQEFQVVWEKSMSKMGGRGGKLNPKTKPIKEVIVINLMPHSPDEEGERKEKNW